MTDTLEALYERKKACSACSLRKSCTQVVSAAGKKESPLLLICGEAPSQEDDEAGEPFVGPAGRLLRRTLKQIRFTKADGANIGAIRPDNTLVTNVLGCRPLGNKFPKDDSATVCVSKWLVNEIALAKPKRMLLLGSMPLKYVAGMTGITKLRGTWIDVGGVRTMPTFHPSYILRMEANGDPASKAQFTDDIRKVAEEIWAIENP